MRKLTRGDLLEVQKPVRYVGGEFNECFKDKENKVRICDAYSNLYEIGIKDKTFNDIYYIQNLDNDVFCERVFFPYCDVLNIMKQKNIALTSLESNDFLTKFDMIVFNVNDVLEYPNVLKMLEISSFPLYSKVRMEEKYPFVMALGDAINLNCLPLSEFVDFFIIGNANDALKVVVEKYKSFKSNNLPKIEFLRSLKNVQGIYVPSIHKNNNLIYSAKDSELSLKNNKFICPNMYEAYNKTVNTIDVYTISNKIRTLLDLKNIDLDTTKQSIQNLLNQNVNLNIRFTIGLPTETYEDILETIKFIKDITNNSTLNNITVTFDNFLIYPHTKLQWYKKNNLDELINKQKFILNNIEDLTDNINFTFISPHISLLKQLLLFCDQNLFKFLEELKNQNFFFYDELNKGCIEIAEQININNYQEYLKEKNIDYKFDFNNFVLPESQEIKLRKEYKKFYLNLHSENGEEENL